MGKQHKRHCHLTMTVTDQTTGERRQLSEEEVAKRLQAMLSIPIEERVRMGLRRAGYGNEEKQQ